MAVNNGTVVAANRFGLGARPGELDAIGSRPREWLVSQVRENREEPDLIRRLSGSAEVANMFLEFRRLQGQAFRQDDVNKAMSELTKRGITPASIYRKHVLARSINAVITTEPFYERLVHFWSNHFAVSVNSGKIMGLVGPFETEAIRPNICGYFSDLLIAAEKHPAMLEYLNNDESVGPDSRFAIKRNGKRRKGKLGINENLGREILELHTLGVNGGYTQADVIEFAKAITGWSVGGSLSLNNVTPGIYHFNEAIHEPGIRTILGKRYMEEGVRQGEAILRDLAVHPSTARHVSTKLARHFISDEPTESCIAAITGVFLHSGGHLPSVYEALVNSDEAWQQVRCKYKTPQDLIYSTFRALNFIPDKKEELLRAFRVMGQSPWDPGSPAGWPDTEADWAGSEALYARLEFSVMMAEKTGNGMDPELLAVSVLGPAIERRTLDTIKQAESAQQGLALLFSSAEFQRR